MDSNRQKLSWAALGLLLAAAAAAFILGRVGNALALHAGAALAAAGFAVACVSALQMRLEERERLERLEYDELTRSAPSESALFSRDAEAFPARRTREQFERFVAPAISILILLGEAAAAVLLWRWVMSHPPAALREHMLLMAVLGLLALLLYMLGRYVAGVARLENSRLLQPASGFLLLTAYLMAVLAGTVAADWAEFRQADRWMALAICIVLGLLALEMLLGLLFEAYRPRIKGKEARLLYDSRLVGLMSRPESLVTTLAHALDYQFGFRVSETWFYRFLERALAWILLAQLAILLGSTTFVMIDAGEQGLLERFGKPVPGRALLGPGLHFKLPWPVDRVYRHRTDELQSFMVGMVLDDKPAPRNQAILWTVGHAKEEFNLLVANRELTARTNALNNGLTNADSARKAPPVNLLAVNIPVQFQVTNLTAWAYGHRDGAALLERLATREVVRYLVNADINEIMSKGRGAAGEALRERIQAAANAHGLGTRIVFVGMAGIHPPVAVADAYEKVVAAMQEAEARVLEARAHALQTNAIAAARAYQKVQAAHAERLRLERDALARAAAFTNQLPAFLASPSVYASRAYLQTWTRAVGEARKYILVSSNTSDVLQINLEDKFRSDLLNVPPPGGGTR